MTYVTAAFLYPLLLGALSLGTGLLVERLTGRDLPGVLVPVIGFCALMVIAQFLVIRGATAPATPWVLVFAALLGGAVGWRALRDRYRRLSWGSAWWLLPPVFTYLTVASPLIAAGHATFPGYLLDTTAGIHLAAAQYIVHHGMQFPSPYPAYGAMFHAYYGSGYPTGGQVLLGATGELTGQSLVWMYFPFQVFALAMGSLVLSYIATRAGLRPWAAALSAWIAAVPALVTSYAMMGSIKEFSAMPALFLVGAWVVGPWTRGVPRPRTTIPLAIAFAAAVAAIGPSAAAWIVVLGIGLMIVLAASVWRSRRRGNPEGPPQAEETSPPTQPLAYAGRARRPSAQRLALGASVATVIAVFVVLVVPTLVRLRTALNTAKSLNGSGALGSDPGNLLRPLRFVQVFGVWLGGDHRVDPQYVDQTYLLIGVVIVAFAAGIFYLARHSNWPHLVWLGASFIIWLVLFERGTEWTDAKVMMLTSPIVVLVAMIGALGDLRRAGVVSGALALTVGVALLGSDLLLYHSTNIAPTARFQELAYIGQRFDNQGPTLITDFDEYTFYELGGLRVDGPGYAPDMRGEFVIAHGSDGYGISYDPDNLVPSVQQYRLIVMRRSPRWSRPPSNFRLAYDGRYYEVWKRAGPPPVLHVPLGAGAGGEGSTIDPIDDPSCRLVRRLAIDAESHRDKLDFATRAPQYQANLDAGRPSPSVSLGTDAEGLPTFEFSGAGQVQQPIQVIRRGTYDLWLAGNVGNRPMEVLVDGQLIGHVTDSLGGDGNVSDVGRIRLSAGEHLITLLRGGGSLAPGSKSATSVDGIYLAQGLNANERPMTLAPSHWKTLCGRPLDWIEVVR